MDVDVAGFCVWFSNHALRLRAIAAEDAIEEIHARLAKVSAGLAAEIHEGEDVSGLVLGCHGKPELLPLAREIGAALGEPHGWAVTVKPA